MPEDPGKSLALTVTATEPHQCIRAHKWPVRQDAAAREERGVKGHIGDRIVVHGPHAGDPDRVGTITGVRHDDGSPPFDVRWHDDGHEGLLFPGPDAVIQAKTPETGR
jgi:hypothetical protein